MNLNLYDADLHIQRQKELARAAADSYRHARYLPKRDLRHAYRHTLVAVGGALINLGVRLQGGLDELGVPELSEPLALRANGAGRLTN